MGHGFVLIRKVSTKQETVPFPAERIRIMKKKEYLYHYTCKECVESILDEGLRVSPSNLLPPVNMRIVNGSVVSDTDWYKPVVWLTDSDSPEKNGLDGSSFNKKEIRISVEKTDEYKFWNIWANQNHMDKSWKKALTKGYNYLSWFVIERPVRVQEIVKVENIVTGEILY